MSFLSDSHTKKKIQWRVVSRGTEMARQLLWLTERSGKRGGGRCCGGPVLSREVGGGGGLREGKVVPKSRATKRRKRKPFVKKESLVGRREGERHSRAPQGSGFEVLTASVESSSSVPAHQLTLALGFHLAIPLRLDHLTVRMLRRFTLASCPRCRLPAVRQTFELHAND